MGLLAKYLQTQKVLVHKASELSISIHHHCGSLFLRKGLFNTKTGGSCTLSAMCLSPQEAVWQSVCKHCFCPIFSFIPWWNSAGLYASSPLPLFDFSLLFCGHFCLSLTFFSNLEIFSILKISQASY